MIAVIHSYCAFDYQKILVQKFRRMRTSGLLESLDKIYIPVVNYKKGIKFFEDYKKLSPKIEVFELESSFKNECDTLNWLKKKFESEPNTPILYTHTKGVTQKHPTIKKNVDLWVKYMDYWCIWNWKECVESLKSFDTAGGVFYGNHYCGNFYWLNSDYMKTLPTIDQEIHKNINRGEFWIGCNSHLNAYDVNKISFPEGHDFYLHYYIAPDTFPQGF